MQTGTTNNGNSQNVAICFLFVYRVVFILSWLWWGSSGDFCYSHFNCTHRNVLARSGLVVILTGIELAGLIVRWKRIGYSEQSRRSKVSVHFLSGNVSEPKAGIRRQTHAGFDWLFRRRMLVFLKFSLWNRPHPCSLFVENENETQICMLVHA